MTAGQFLLSHLHHAAALSALVFGSAFFSGSETAMFSLSRAQVMRFRQGRGRLGHLVGSLLREPRRLLMTILLGNQLVNVAFFVIATDLLADAGRELPGGWLVELLLHVAPVLLVILFGEVCPKNLAISSPPRFAQLVAAPLALLVRVLGPVQWGISFLLIEPLTRLLQPLKAPKPALTAGELANLLDLSGRRGMITHNESAWLREVIRLNRLKVADIMVPRVDMVAFDIDDDPAELAARFRKTRLVRIPVFRSDLDHALGVVHAKDLLLNPGRSLDELVRPIPFVPELGTVDRLLERLQQTHAQQALVVDEYGGTAGLVTLHDVLEEIVGELTRPDESAAESVREVGAGEYLVDSRLAIREWTEAFGTEMPDDRISTVGGLVMSLLDRVPRVGDTVQYGNLELTVGSMRGFRIRQVRVRLLDEGARS